MAMADYESRPLGEISARTNQADSDEGLRVVPEVDKKTTAPDLVDARTRIENNLTQFSQATLR